MRLPTTALVLFLTAAGLLRAELPEFNARAGWPNFLAKLKTPGAEVKIAYLGGSITAQEGWRPKTLKWFQEQNPGVKISQIPAAVGGTGSDLGVFRLGHDALAQKPDLLLVEFAVNDGGAAPERIHKGMEGIVRQTWRELPACDIGFVYTIAGGMPEEEKEGRLPRSKSAMEQVAEHYGIPTVNFGTEVVKRLAAGTLVMKGEKPQLDGKTAFSPDGVHPFPETGHEIYREAFSRLATAVQAVVGGPKSHTLSTPLRADNWEKATMVPLEKAWLKGGWTTSPEAVAKSFASRLSPLWEAATPGDALEFTFRGTAAGIYDVIGPDGGQVRVILDGKDTGLKPRFDSYCTYHRLSQLWIGEGLPDGPHTVRIELVAEPLDKAAILAKRNETMKDPARFAPLHWHAGALLILGDVEK